MTFLMLSTGACKPLDYMNTFSSRSSEGLVLFEVESILNVEYWKEKEKHFFVSSFAHSRFCMEFYLVLGIRYIFLKITGPLDAAKIKLNFNVV